MHRRLPHSLIATAIIVSMMIGCGNGSQQTVQWQDGPPPTPEPVDGPGSEPPPQPDNTPGAPNPEPSPEPSPKPAPEPPSDIPPPAPETCDPEVLCIVPVTINDGTVSEAYVQELTVQGGSGVGVTWKIVEGDLPDGLSLDGRNGPLSWEEFALVGEVDFMAATLAAKDLTEISGIAASRLQPGVLWIIDDSGGGPDLFAIDESGAVLQKYSISNATNRDWEDMAIGPGPDPDKEYLYIGDVGDNSASRGNYQIVRLEEPVVPAIRQDPIPLSAETFFFVYPDGPKNCEAILIDWQTAIIYLIQKTGGIGRVYAFPSPMDDSWTAAHPTTLLPVSAVGMVSGQVTGADASRDAERVLVRQYDLIWEYARTPGAPFATIFDEVPVAVAVGAAKDQQYESICYSGDGTEIVTVTEKAGGADVPVYVASATPGALSSSIAGIPSAPGTFSFAVQAKDTSGATATRAFDITIAP